MPMAHNPEAHCSECKIVLEYPQTMCGACEQAFVQEGRDEHKAVTRDD